MNCIFGQSQSIGGNNGCTDELTKSGGTALDSQKALFLLTCNRFYIVGTLHNVNFVYCGYCWDKKEYKRKLQKQRL